MTNIRKDTLITVLDPDIETPTLTDAWYQGVAAKGGFYAVLVDEPLAQRVFKETDIVTAPYSVVQELARAAAARNGTEAPEAPKRPVPVRTEPFPQNVTRLKRPPPCDLF